MLAPWKKRHDKPRQNIKKQRHHFANKGRYSQSYGSSSSHVWMWELGHTEGWAPNNWCFRIVALEKILKSPRRSSQLILKEMTLNIHWKYWCWNWRSNNLTICWEEPTHWKDPDAGKDWGWEEKGVTEDEMVWWHHQHNEHEFEQTPGDSEGQGSLECCSPWSHKELDMTLQLNNNPWPLLSKDKSFLRNTGEDDICFSFRTIFRLNTVTNKAR